MKCIKNEMDDYIALHTYDYKLSFCQATNELPGDMQRLVWEKLNTYESRDLVCPGAPQRASGNPRFSKERLETLVNRWREKWGEPTP